MSNTLKVSNNQNILGPIYIQIHPIILTYSGMSYLEIKSRVKTILGSYKETRYIYNLMHSLSRNDITNYSNLQFKDKYSPFIYYFEIFKSSNLKLIIYKCDFPRIFPNEDVNILSSNTLCLPSSISTRRSHTDRLE